MESVDDALQGAFIVMEKAERELEQGKAEEAVLLALTVLPIIVDMQQYCDDSGGSAGYVIGDSLETLNKATASGELDEQQTKDLFQKILKEAQKKRYAGWSEWRNELLKACIPLCTAAALRKRLKKKQIQKWLDVLNGDDQYDRERLMYLQLQLHERFDGEEKARAFLYAHIDDLESFRERAIQQAIEKSDWTQIVNLCLEGESKDANYLITVNKWKKYRLFAYEKLGDMANQKQLLFDFLYAGDYDSYIKLKALYSPKEWHDVLEEILAAFEKESFYPSAYVEILKTEKRYAQLLNYCKRNPLSIEYLYPELVKDYPDDVSRLFVQWIEEEATYSANRPPQYRSVCRKIKTYRKACGQSQALQVIKHLEQKYKNRPAFLDELEKVK
ncbi:hypothetical protein QS257_04915 [Terrilactibacillus sp. S3-3]|nr:hypothetical protein QS257_04915 [Terrilactibacillus sp. S3-3]